MDFIKVTNDIYNEYTKFTGKTELNLNDMNSINTILYNYLDSYYFKDLYSAVHLRITDDGYKIPVLLKNAKMNSEIMTVEGHIISIKDLDANNYLNIDPSMLLAVEIQNSIKSSGFKNIPTFEKNYNLKAMSLTDNIMTNTETSVIDQLKSSNPFYSTVFEKNSIKQMLLLQNKKEINIERIDCNGLKLKDIANILSDFHKTPTHQIVNHLATNYDLRYLSTMKTAKSIYIAHNGSEIAGLLATDNSYYLKALEIEAFNKFDYVESIAVAKSFRGLNIGSQLFEAMLKDVTLEQGVVLMSRFSEDGANYLSKKFNKIEEKYPDVTVIHDNEKNDYAYKLIEVLFKNKSETIYYEAKDIDVPQLIRPFNESLSIFKDKITQMRAFNSVDKSLVEIELDKTFKECVDKASIRQKIKPQ